MSTPLSATAAPAAPLSASAGRPRLDQKPTRGTAALFVTLLVGGVAYVTYRLSRDFAAAGMHGAPYLPYLLLGVALLIALGFEFVNGFHDTANAVATVIYTHSLTPNVAVVWSGFFNFMGVLASSGAVAFSIVSLLPVELILQVGSHAGFAMVFALLIAAIIWNLGTWYFGLPNSSSHTLVGSIIGVGVANALLHGHDGTSGVDWSQAAKVGNSLLFSPIVGFICAGLLLLAMKALIRQPALYQEPRSSRPPPWWIRSLLVLTCTGVSFAHGSNDGQKGMGLIMLILVGIVPTAYALNRAVPDSQVSQFVAVARATQQSLLQMAPAPEPADAKAVLADYLRTKELNAQVLPALTAITGSIGHQVSEYGTFRRLPGGAAANVRNDMYVASEAIRLLQKNPKVSFTKDATNDLGAFKKNIDNATKFIPTWVKVAVAIALGLGTMVGWKRIVVTVGERIGKAHLTYAQGASAEIVTMATIGAADMYGLPVSTTHVLTSGVAGTMAANGSGLQWATVRNLAAAWVLTLPMAIVLSAVLYWLFLQMP